MPKAQEGISKPCIAGSIRVNEEVADDLARTLINDYGEGRAARGVKANTIYGESVKLRIFAAWLLRRGVMDIHAVTPEHITDYQADLVTTERHTKTGPKKLSPSYRHDLVASVGRFFKWLSSARRIVINPAAQIELGHAEPHQPTNVMTEAETVLLIDSTDGDSPNLIRDRAILGLLYSTGLRRAEIAALDLTDIDKKATNLVGQF